MQDVIGFGSKRDLMKKSLLFGMLVPILVEKKKFDKETKVMTKRYILLRDRFLSRERKNGRMRNRLLIYWMTMMM
ncbi:hypothetical protein V3595_08015 [Bacillus sp. CFBP9009]